MRLRRRGQIFIALAALAWSTAGVMQRGLDIDTTTQLAGRALFAFLALLAFVAVLNRGRAFDAFRSMGRAGLAVALCMAVASSSFIVALNHANVANVLFMQAVAPVLAALLAWTALGEAVTRRTAAAMAIALLGVTLMVGGTGSGGFIGVGASFLMTLAFAAVIVITRHKREVSMAPAICLSQLLVFLAFAPLAEASTVSRHDLALLVALGVGQMGLGLAFLTAGARLIPAAEVALITLLEIVLGPLWVWIGYGEEPGLATLVGGAVVVVAVLLQTLQRAAPTVEVVAHDPKWRGSFEAERRLLERLLKPWLDGGVHHIGSTAVPGLAAKPIVDVMAGVRDLEDAREAFGPLLANGYEHDPHRPGIAHHFSKRENGRVTHGLHLTEPGSDLWRERLAFRDALLADQQLAAEYEGLKRELAREHSGDPRAYTDGKRAFVAAVLARSGLQPGRR